MEIITIMTDRYELDLHCKNIMRDVFNISNTDEYMQLNGEHQVSMIQTHISSYLSKYTIINRSELAYIRGSLFIYLNENFKGGGNVAIH